MNRWIQFRLLVWLAFAICASGQVVRVQIYAPEGQLVAGSSARFIAVALNSAGQQVPNAVINWSSNNQTATVDSSGMVTGNAIGIVTIAAAVGNIRSQVNIQVVPWRVEIDPPSAVVYVGESRQFTARALNRQGELIPGVNFNWNSVNRQLVLPGTLGEVTGLVVGETWVRAEVNFGQGGVAFYGTFAAQAFLRIRNRPAYRIERLVSGDQVGHSFQVRTTGLMSANEAGNFTVNASLDGLATAALLWRDGRIEMADDTVQSNYEPRINATGDVLIVNGQGIGILRNGRVIPKVPNGYSTVELYDNIFVDGRAWPQMNDRGDVVFYARYRDSPDAPMRTNRGGVFRTIRNTVELLWNVDNPDASFALRLGIDGAANVYIHHQTFGPSGQFAIYRLPGRGERQKIVASGDLDEGSPIAWVTGFALNDAGDLVYTYDAGRGQRVVKRSSSGAITAQSLSCCNTQVLQVTSWGAVLLLTGSSLQLWEDGTVRQVLAAGVTAPNGEPVRGIKAAFLTASGDLIVQASLVETADSIFRVNADRSRQTLLEIGGRVDVTARLRLDNSRIVRGKADGNPFVMLGAGGLFELTADGLVPRLLNGDKLPDGTLYAGGNAIQSGDNVWLSANGRLFRITPSGISRMFPGDNTGFGGFIAANAKGTVVAQFFGNAENGLMLIEGGNMRRIAIFSRPDGTSDPGPAGGFFTNCDSIAIDGGGRVMCHMRVRNGPSGHYVYTDGQWRYAPPVPGMVHSDLQGQIAASGEAFYARFPLRSGEQYIGVYREDRWEQLFGIDYTLPNGSNNTFRNFSQLDSSTGGNLLIDFITGSQQLFVHHGRDQWSYVQSVLDPLPDGEYCTNIRDMAIREDGRVYFGADTSKGHYAIYSATPIDR